jgi:hypothetical protein
MAVWIVQLQQEHAVSYGYTIVPGSPSKNHSFRNSEGISMLRQLAAQVEGKNEGILVIGKVGMTSHIADILRRLKIPSKVVFEEEVRI